MTLNDGKRRGRERPGILDWDLFTYNRKKFRNIKKIKIMKNDSINL